MTLNTILLGAWAILLNRYSGDSDVLFGATVSGRPSELSGVEDMVGMFINTLPARVRLEDQRPIDDWLRTIQIAQTEARQFQYSALGDVQRWAPIIVVESMGAIAPFVLTVTGAVDVWTDDPDSLFYCYGSVLDNVTSDPTTIPPQ